MKEIKNRLQVKRFRKTKETYLANDIYHAAMVTEKLTTTIETREKRSYPLLHLRMTRFSNLRAVLALLIQNRHTIGG